MKRAAWSLTLLALWCAPLGAQPAGAQAEVLFRHGKELLAAGKIAEACAAFDSSQQLEPTVSTLLNQANCREKNGQLATAWGQFLDAARQTRSATDDATKKLHDVATEHAGKLEPRLSTLTIVVANERRIAGLHITRGDEAVASAAWSTALPIDGGTYTITARAPGMQDWSTSIAIEAEHDAKTVEVPALVPVPAAAPIVATVAPPVPPVEDHPSHRRTYATIVLIGGGVIVGAGLYVGELARAKWNDVKALCGTDLLCDPTDRASGDQLLRDARLRANISTGMVAGGIVALGAGVALWLTAPAHVHRVMIGTSATPLGMTVEGRF